MDILSWVAVFLFAVTILLFITEGYLSIQKSSVALVSGVFMWILVSIQKSGEVHTQAHTAMVELAEVVFFLLFAMTLVEVLRHYGLFDSIQYWLYRRNLKDGSQIWILAAITALLSAVIDNLTATIVMIEISRRFAKGRNLLVMVCAVVLSANIGGAPSPIGDVTTLMLWVAKKFSATEVISYVTTPALVMWLVAIFLLSRKIESDTVDQLEDQPTAMTRSEKFIVTVTALCFFLPMVMVTVFHLPSFFGLGLGLGVVWLTISIMQNLLPEHPTHLGADIKEFVQKADITALKFFIGILLCVSGLNAMGILPALTNAMFGANPSDQTVIFGNIGLGLLSAVLDNIPLVALGIAVVPSTNPELWSLLALTAGTGGSIFVFGSAAGVVAMEIMESLHRKGEAESPLDFGTYFKIATGPAILSFFAGVAAWWLQYQIFN